MQLASSGWTDYELLDSGSSTKLERFGPYRLIRPEPQANWLRTLPADWQTADATFHPGDDPNTGVWQFRREIPSRWIMTYKHLKFWAAATPYRHLGVFPEQAVHWDWLSDLITASNRPIRVLNLFGYTGLATLAAASAGASVTHVDASKKAIAWAKENQAASGLSAAPIRWMLDDAAKFVAREVRRGKSYHLILVDPPKFGRGPEGEVWDVFTHLAPLLRDCAALLAPERAALVLTTYAIRASALATDGLVRECLEGRGGAFESGELAVIEQSGGRLLPTSLYTRWTGNEAKP